MAINIPNWLNPFYTRNKSGDSIYMFSGNNEWTANTNNLYIAQNHPILTPALLFVSKLFSQARFHVEEVGTGKRVEHKILDLLNNPNYYQTKNDLLESLMFMQIAQGKAVLYVKKSFTFNEPESFFLLNVDLIEYPDDFITPMRNRAYDKTIANQRIVYDSMGENLKIKFGDLLFFYDLPNAMHKNMFDNSSRSKKSRIQ